MLNRREMYIARVLLRDGVLSENQLGTALQNRYRIGGSLCHCLVTLGIVDEGILTCALSRQYGIPAIYTLNEWEPDPAALKMITAKVAWKFEVLPLHHSGRDLILAMVDPMNLTAVKDIEFLTASTIEPVIASEHAIKRQLLRYYGPMEEW
jgi:hypothetical protein